MNRHRLLAVPAVAAALFAATGPAPAFAHVHASSPGAVRGGFATVTFEVPNESESGSATTELTVTLPDVAAARTETMPGWTARLDRDARSGAVRSVTWTAGSGTGIGADQFGLFRLRLRLPDTETVTFPSAQRYADGTVVRWDQPPLADGTEPERPVPTLHLAAGPLGPPEHHHAGAGPAPAVTAAPEGPAPAGHPGHADNTARALGGAALLVAALAGTIALVRRRA